MAHVLVLDSINEDMFVCGNCKTVFNSLQVFVDHKRQHCKEPSFEKESSDKNVQSDITKCADAVDSSTVGHSEVITDKTPSNGFSCGVCRKKFKRMKSLHVHLRTHNERPYQCPVCGRCFIQNSHLQRHIVSHKVWPDGLTETTAKSSEEDLLSYSCSYCGLILANYLQYRAHLKNHLSIKMFKCIQGQCVVLFETVENLLHHVLAVHSPPVYICHICNETFDTLESIAIHQQTHNKEEKVTNVIKEKHYKCLQCDAMFTKPEKLSLHMLTENHEKTCIHCKKTFASDKRLRLHLQIHRKLKPFQCNICGSSFHMKKYLSSHMLRHGERQFTCDVCNLKFKRQDLLKRHMKLHQKKKLLKCPFRDTLGCKMEFSRNDKMKSHIKIHTKKMTVSTNVSKTLLPEENSQIVEICILPLDTKINS